MSESSPSDPDSGLPPDVPAPPPPRPDLKDLRESGPTYGASEKRKGNPTEGRRHPTDPYAPLPRRRGCGGCFGCLGGLGAALALLILALVAGSIWFGSGRFVSKGYRVVNLKTDAAVLDSPPSEATLYIAPGSLHYRAPVTSVPVALLGREITIEGDFLDAFSVTGAKVTATEKARFAKDLEVYAAEFTDLGMTLKGELKGRVIENLP